MQTLRTAIRFPRCCQIGQTGLIGFCLLLGFSISPVSSQEASTPAPNAEILPLESSRITLRVGSQGTQVAELQAMLKLLGYYGGVVDGVYQESTAIAVTAFQQAAGLTADGIVGPGTWGRLLPASPSVNGSSSGTVGAIAPAASNPATPDTAETTAATLAFPAPSSIEPTATPSTTANAPEAVSTASTSTPGTPEGNTSAPATNSSVPATAQSTIDLPILRVGMRGPAVTRLQERLRATGFFNGVADGVFGVETQNAVRAAQRNFNLEPDGVVGPATWSALLR